MKRLLMTAFVLLLILSPLQYAAQSRAAAHNPITFNIADDVSPEDVNYVTEGIRLAQDYLSQDLKVEADHRTIVNIRGSAAPVTIGELGESAMDYIAIFTGSRGWSESAPFFRVEVTVHEFIHVYQTDHLGEGHFDLVPAWIVEGMAEYLAADAIVSRGLLRRSFADSYRLWILGRSSLGTLESYESLAAFQQEGGQVYALSYLGIKALLDGRSSATLIDFFDAIARGAPWELAFADTFGIQPADFYQQFERARSQLHFPAEPPVVYDLIEGQEFPAPVRLTRVNAPLGTNVQLIALAKSEPTARCIFYLSGLSLDLMHETTVDATGNLFWLETIPPGTPSQTAELSVDCGGGERLIEVEIANSPGSS